MVEDRPIISLLCLRSKIRADVETIKNTKNRQNFQNCSTMVKPLTSKVTLCRVNGLETKILGILKI